MPKPEPDMSMSVEIHLEEALTKRIGVRKQEWSRLRVEENTYRDVIRYREHRPLC